MKDIDFNLLDEPWIVVLGMDGETKEVSLKEAFQHSDEFEGLAGDCPTQDMAIMRLMLAVLYATYLRDQDGRKIDSEDTAVSRWKTIWDTDNFKDGKVLNYLESQRERFWLFHPNFPFFQSVIDKGTPYEAGKLIGDLSESSHKLRLFSNYDGVSKNAVSYAEAARWLLHLNGFDDTSAKPSQRGAGLPSAGAGWLGKLGLVYIRGNSLFETLMLNFVMIDERGEPFADGKPIWEREPTVRERIEIPLPKSPVELLTLQSRRVLLKRNCGKVTGFQLLGGDIAPKENAFIEQMTVWRKTDDGSFIPKRHDPSKSVWRDFSSIVVEADDSKVPGIVRWSKLLKETGVFPYGTAEICVVGLKYIDKDFSVTDTIFDSISLNSGFLSKLGHRWNNRVSELLVLTDDCIASLAHFAKDLCVLDGYDRKIDAKVMEGAAFKVSSQAFFDLDNPFRIWLSSIDPGKTDPDIKSSEWKNIVYSVVVDKVGRSLLANAGLKAFTGSASAKSSGKTGIMDSNAFSMFSKFRNIVMKTLKEGKS